jgi:hypothetical protein
MIYEIRDDGGARETIQADSIEEALELAREWAAEGSYDQRVMVTVWVTEFDENEEPTGRTETIEVEAGPEPRPPRTACGEEDEDHQWAAPQKVVGGLDSNPGVFGLGGTALLIRRVCGRCGIYRIERRPGSQRRPGELDVEISYEPADEISLAWVRSQTWEDDHDA